MIRRRPRTGRRGAAVVEMTAVVSVFLLLLFGVLEYCRYMFMRQLVANAAREGARYCVTSTYRDDVVADTEARVRKFMGGFDSKLDGKIRNFTIQVYRGDANGEKVYAYDSAGGNAFAYRTDGTGKYLETSAGTKVYMQGDSGGSYFPDGSAKVYVKADANTGGVTGADPAKWAAFTGGQQIKGYESPNTAQFGQYIVVEIECDYEPILPSFLFLSGTLRLHSRAVMCSEAN
jgi:Flp pilus assembly protein TadG